MADILLVDDDDQLRGVLRRMLVAGGHAIREAPNGRVATQLMRERPAELLVSDVYMPEMDGVELLIRLRQEFPTLRMVIMSGGGNMDKGDILQIAESLGARATLAKPFLPDQLREAVAAALA